MRLRRVAVWGAGPTGEVEWAAPAFGPGEPPTVIVSPDAEYRVSLFADGGDAEGPDGGAGRGEPYVLLAYWTALGGDANWRVRPTGLSRVAVSWHESARDGTGHEVTVGYPTARQTVARLDSARPIELQTNRSFASVEYARRDVDGHAWVTRPRFYDLSRQRRVVLGGPLAATAWAVASFEEADEGNRLPRVVWGVTVADPAGHQVDADRSGLGLEADASGDGESWSDADPEPESDAAAGALVAAMGVRVTCPELGLDAAVLRAAPSSAVRSARFAATVPQPWRHQGAYYLGKCERMHAVLRALTGRPGPKRSRIVWRTNTHSAKALVGRAGGGGDLWMMMPLITVRSDDYFGNARLLALEMLHNFGYNHGDEMNRLQGEADRAFETFRWHVEDNPAAVPN